MNPRCSGENKVEGRKDTAIENFIERIRKARALGCSLSYLGDDSRVCGKVFSDRIMMSTK